MDEDRQLTTAADFEAAYAARSGVTVEELREIGNRGAKHCDCGEDGCDGWQMAHHVTCHTYWGSHGCALEAGHDGVHICGDDDTLEFIADAEFDGQRCRLRYFDDDGAPDGWSDWMAWEPIPASSPSR